MPNIYLYLDWILLILMSLTFCQQLFSKKFNFYGIVSMLSLAIYVALHSYSTGLSVFVLILFIGGVLLIALEMLIPGGIVGTVGILTLLYAIVYINEATYAISFIIVISFLLAVVLYLVNRKVFNRKLSFLNQLVLTDAITTEDGYIASESRIDLEGKTLVAYTDLRPAGVASYNNEKLDVVTDGDFIEKGKEVKVVRVEGMRIVVRKK